MAQVQPGDSGVDFRGRCVRQEQRDEARDGRAFDGRRDEIEMNSGDVGVRSQSGEQAASGVVSPPPSISVLIYSTNPTGSADKTHNGERSLTSVRWKQAWELLIG